MIEYDKHSWRTTTLVYQGTSAQTMAQRLALFTGLAVAVSLVDALVFRLPTLPPLAHTLIGLALGMLLVFRTNASYDRFWEGRMAWGRVVNASRNLVRTARAWSGPSQDLADLASAWAVALKHRLRNSRDCADLERWLPPQVIVPISEAPNIPLAISGRMSDRIRERVAEGRLDVHLAETLERYVGQLIDEQGVCERIRNTPMPFAYVVTVRQLLLVYLLTLPFVLIGELGFWAIPAAVIITFALLSIEEVGVQIEDPFGTDPNDLPLDDLCERIAQDTAAAGA